MGNSKIAGAVQLAVAVTALLTVHNEFLRELLYASVARTFSTSVVLTSSCECSKSIALILTRLSSFLVDRDGLGGTVELAILIFIRVSLCCKVLSLLFELDLSSLNTFLRKRFKALCN